MVIKFVYYCHYRHHYLVNQITDGWKCFWALFNSCLDYCYILNYHTPLAVIWNKQVCPLEGTGYGCSGCCPIRLWTWYLILEQPKVLDDKTSVFIYSNTLYVAIWIRLCTSTIYISVVVICLARTCRICNLYTHTLTALAAAWLSGSDSVRVSSITESVPGIRKGIYYYIHRCLNTRFEQAIFCRYKYWVIVIIITRCHRFYWTGLIDVGQIS